MSRWTTLDPTLDIWGKFLAAKTDAEREQLAMKNPDLRQAKVALERLSADPDARILVEMRDRAMKSYHLDIGKARREGRVEGIEEGRTKGRVEGIEEGRTKGQAALLSGQLSIKFGVLPPSVVERLERASESELLRWGTKLFAADLLDAVFDDR